MQPALLKRSIEKEKDQNKAHEKAMKMLTHQAPLDIVVRYLRDQYKYIERKHA